MKIRTIILRRKKALKSASPKKRDKLRQLVREAEKALQIQKELAA